LGFMNGKITKVTIGMTQQKERERGTRF